jgi:hypothetical protein
MVDKFLSQLVTIKSHYIFLELLDTCLPFFYLQHVSTAAFQIKLRASLAVPVKS